MQLQQAVVCVSALLSTQISLLGLQAAGCRIVGDSWRTRQLLQVPAGGISPLCDPAVLPGAYALFQSVLCFEMKAEALAEYFLSHWCSVFGHDRK